MNLHETISTSPFLWFPFSREWKGFMFNANTTYKVGPERIANGAHLVPTTGYDQSFALAEFWQKFCSKGTTKSYNETSKKRSSVKLKTSSELRYPMFPPKLGLSLDSWSVVVFSCWFLPQPFPQNIIFWTKKMWLKRRGGAKKKDPKAAPTTCGKNYEKLPKNWHGNGTL